MAVNVPCMMASNVAAQTALNSSIRRTHNGTEKILPDGNKEVKYFKFTKEDIGKFIVIKFRYEEHGFGIDRLSINNHILNTHSDEIYGVYKIGYHDWCKETEDISYKINLKPVGKFIMWCPNRSWYTHDMESMINKTYNLFEENPLFENELEAIEFALKKNFEIYKDKRSWFKKLIDKIFKFNK